MCGDRGLVAGLHPLDVLFVFAVAPLLLAWFTAFKTDQQQLTSPYGLPLPPTLDNLRGLDRRPLQHLLQEQPHHLHRRRDRDGDHLLARRLRLRPPPLPGAEAAPLPPPHRSDDPCGRHHHPALSDDAGLSPAQHLRLGHRRRHRPGGPDLRLHHARLLQGSTGRAGRRGPGRRRQSSRSSGRSCSRWPGPD